MSDKTKEIICFFLFLFISVIIPIDINGCFRTIRIIQDNIRPFVVVFITLSFTIYLKIYNDVEKRHNDDIEKFKKDFHNAYEKLQKDIKTYQDCNLDQDSAEKKGVEFEGQKIKTKLRYLMQRKIINKKCDFFSFHENYLLWKKPKQMHACDCILENDKNLLQDCIDKIFEIDKNEWCSYVNFCFAELSGIQFRNIKISNTNYGINIKGALLGGSDFSNSDITFTSHFIGSCEWSLEDKEEKVDKNGMLNDCIFDNSNITFDVNYLQCNDIINDYQFPRIYAIYSDNSVITFKVSINIGHIGSTNDDDIKNITTKITDITEQMLINKHYANRLENNTIFEFNFINLYTITDKKLYDILTKEVEKYNDKDKKIVISFHKENCF